MKHPTSFVAFTLLATVSSTASAATDPCLDVKWATTDKQISTCELDGTMKLGMENFDGAAKAFGKIIEVDPENTDAMINRGWALLKLGKRESSLGDFKQALAILNTKLGTNPKDDKLLHQRATLYRRAGLFAEAQKDLTTALTFKPDSQMYQIDNQVVAVEVKTATGAPTFTLAELSK